MNVSSSKYAATVRATPSSSAYSKIICGFMSDSQCRPDSLVLGDHKQKQLVGYGI